MNFSKRLEMRSHVKMMRHIVVAAFFSVLANGAPRSPLYVDDKAQNYLMKYGYLPQTDVETGNLRTEDQLRDAIKNLQKFGGIPMTGEIDEATRKLMESRRCGLPDQPDPRFTGTRYKRFTIHGQHWEYLNLTWSICSDGISEILIRYYANNRYENVTTALLKYTSA